MCLDCILTFLNQFYWVICRAGMHQFTCHLHIHLSVMLSQYWLADLSTGDTCVPENTLTGSHFVGLFNTIILQNFKFCLLETSLGLMVYKLCFNIIFFKAQHMYMCRHVPWPYMHVKEMLSKHVNRTHSEWKTRLLLLQIWN